MSERRAVGLTVLVLLGLVVVPAAGAGAATTSSPDSAAAVQSNFDRTTFVVRVFENGSARWTFQYSQPLTNESERQDFRTYAATFNENETELYRNFQTRADWLTRAGTNATGREMTATGFTRRAYVAGPSGNQGVVEMSFLWTNFAVVQGDAVTVGDVFDGGLYLAPNQRFRVEHGPDLAFRSAVAPSPDSMSGPSVAESDSLTWSGERQFTDEKPHVELGPSKAGGADGAGTSPGPGGGGGMGLVAMVALALVLVLGAVGAVAWRTGALGDDAGSGAASAASDGDDEPPAGGTAPAADEEVASEPAVPDEELLSDEDRVLQLLEENGGRMKQVNIVEDTGWSKSKVSMLLSDMADEEQISKLRVGRENVISLKGHEPDAARSPFDDDE
ncbi:MAG: helix-turn-helix transcriptional regulator [Haloarculaceae archaeon]